MPDDEVYSPSAGDYSDSGGGVNFLTNKMGPFPTYIWLLVGVAIIYFWYRYKNSTSTSTGTASSGTDASGTSTDTGGTTGTIDSTGNVNDSLTALGQLVSLQAGTIADLVAKEAALQKEEKQLSTDVAVLNKRTKPKPKPKPIIRKPKPKPKPIHKPVHK
jgi:hypothetical protein